MYTHLNLPVHNYNGWFLEGYNSELDEIWYVSSACGFMKPDKISYSYVVWHPG